MKYILKLQLGSRVFAPSWFSVVLTALLLPGLLSLGFWQLRRAQEKRDLMAQAEQGRQQTLSYATATASLFARYQHVSANGHYDPTHQVLLDNMPSAAGQPGYRVLTPLRLDDGGVLLVDRGWLAAGTDRDHLPDVAVATDLRRVAGILDELPRPGVRAGDAGIATGQWPQRLNYPTYAELQALYGAGLQPRILLLDATESAGYERHWLIDVGFTPERHVAYAVQWFGLAATLLVIFVVVNLRRLPPAA